MACSIVLSLPGASEYTFKKINIGPFTFPIQILFDSDWNAGRKYCAITNAAYLTMLAPTDFAVA